MNQQSLPLNIISNTKDGMTNQEPSAFEDTDCIAYRVTGRLRGLLKIAIAFKEGIPNQVTYQGVLYQHTGITMTHPETQRCLYAMTSAQDTSLWITQTGDQVFENQ